MMADEKIIRLPVEVLDRVLSHTRHLPPDDLASELHYRRELWFPLSVVCKHFRHRTLPALFSGILVERAPASQDRTHSYSVDLTSSSVVEFCRAIIAGDAAARRLAALVRVFTIRTTSDRSECYNAWPLSKQTDYLQAVSYMPNVYALRIRGGIVNIVGCLLDVPNVLQLPKLSTLSIVQGGLAAPRTITSRLFNLHHIQRCSSNMTRLELTPSNIHSSLDDPGAGDQVIDTLASCSNLRSICVVGAVAAAVISKSLKTMSCRKLDTVEILLNYADYPHFIAFLNSASQITTLRLHNVNYPPPTTDNESILAFEQLSPTALPRLTTVQCQIYFCKFLLPGRPVRDVAWNRGQSGSLIEENTYIGNAISTSESEFACLAQTVGPVHTLRLDTKVYLRLKGQPGLLPDSLQISMLVLIRFSRFSTRELPWETILDNLGCDRLPGLTRLRVEWFCEDCWDLWFQHRVISETITRVFPRVTRVQLSPWIDWRREITESCNDWFPVLYAEEEHGNGAWPVQRFRRLLQNMEVRKRATDYAGFFESFGVEGNHLRLEGD
ncbi:hypothetical protein BDV98DRAFT_567975, partial [Pterulicium gracile]